MGMRPLSPERTTSRKTGLPVPPPPLTVCAEPPRKPPTYLVRDLVEHWFVARSDWPCHNPTCGALIRRGQHAARTVTAEYLHAGCVIQGFPAGMVPVVDHGGRDQAAAPPATVAGS